MESEIEYPLCFGLRALDRFRHANFAISLPSLCVAAFRGRFQHRSRSVVPFVVGKFLAGDDGGSKQSIDRIEIGGRRQASRPLCLLTFSSGNFPEDHPHSCKIHSSSPPPLPIDKIKGLRGSTDDNCTARFHSEYRSSNSNTVPEKLVAHHARSKLKLF